jgi:hypothetical protein
MGSIRTTSLTEEHSQRGNISSFPRIIDEHVPGMKIFSGAQKIYKYGLDLQVLMIIRTTAVYNKLL